MFVENELNIDSEELATELFTSLWPDLDITDEHVRNTPKRFTKMLRDLTTKPEFEFTMFKNEGIDEMVLVKNIEFHSLCSHHLLPFIGKAHVAYIPNDKIAGLSKLARAVAYLQAGLWTQEHLTWAIANFLEEHLEPLGVAVVMEAEHLCMTLRGIEAKGALTTTSKMTGVFADHARLARTEFLSLINK